MNHENSKPRGTTSFRHGWIQGLKRTSLKLCHSLSISWTDSKYSQMNNSREQRESSLTATADNSWGHIWCPFLNSSLGSGMAILLLARPGMRIYPFGWRWGAGSIPSSSNKRAPLGKEGSVTRMVETSCSRYA